LEAKGRKEGEKNWRCEMEEERAEAAARRRDATCVSLFLSHLESRQVGIDALHGGWRGLFKKALCACE
jgi:copper oxidase (laccase) domain-containing protein